MNLLLKDQS